MRYFMVILLFLTQPVYAQLQPNWFSTYSHEDSTCIMDKMVEKDGFYYLAGSIEGDTHDSRGLIVKFSSAGVFQWKDTFYPPASANPLVANTFVKDIIFRNNAMLVYGIYYDKSAFDDTFFIREYSASGTLNYEWNHRGRFNENNLLSFDANNNAHLLSAVDTMIVRYTINSAGQLIDSIGIRRSPLLVAYSLGEYIYQFRITTDPFSTLKIEASKTNVVTGQVELQRTINTPVYTADTIFDLQGIYYRNSGFYVAGNCTNNTKTDHDLFLLRLDTALNFKWIYNAHTPADRSDIVGGYYHFEDDYAYAIYSRVNRSELNVVKLNADNGNVLWQSATQTPGVNTSIVKDIKLLNSNLYFLSNYPVSRYTIRKYNSEGNLMYSLMDTVNKSSFRVPSFVPLDDNNYTVAGDFIDTNHNIVHRVFFLKKYRYFYSGIEKERVSGFSLYPNPSGDKIMIKSENVNEGDVIEVYSIQGQKVYTGIFSKGVFTLHKRDIGAGIFIIRIKNAGVVFTDRFIFTD